VGSNPTACISLTCMNTMEPFLQQQEEEEEEEEEEKRGG
jgi:hypothetical protein